MAPLAVKRHVKLLAFANRVLRSFQQRRFRHRRNFDVRIRERNVAAQLESTKARGTALRFWRGHRPRGSKQARARAPTDGGNDVLLAIHGKSDGDRVDGGFGLNGPEFFSGVRGISGKFASSLPLKNEIASGGKNATIHGDFFFDRPTLFFRNGIPSDEPAEKTFATFAGFDRRCGVRTAIGRGNVD